MKFKPLMIQKDVDKFISAEYFARRSISVRGIEGLKLIQNRPHIAAWVLEYMCPDTQMRQLIRLGESVSCDLERAKLLARKFVSKLYLSDLAEMVLPSPAVSLGPTFEAFAVNTYLPSVKARKKSLGTDISLLKNHLLPVFGDRLLAEIKPLDVQSFVNGLSAKGMAPASRNRILMLLKFMFNSAIKWEVPGVVSNPCKGISDLLENNKMERFLSSDEAQRLRAAIAESANPMLGPIIELLMLTGCRKGEALQAKKTDFDFERGSWLVPNPKGGKARYIPMNGRAVDTVRGALLLAQNLNPRFEQTEYVFANPRTGLPFEQIYFSWNAARTKAGLEDLRIHDLRHSFASAMVNSGMTLYDVKEILGHANIKTTQRYAHLSNSRLRKAAESVSDFYGDQGWGQA
jgi:site-specific recombinase XerD